MKIRIIHILDIKFSYIENYLEVIAEQGFNYIQISPIQPLKLENHHKWWMAYQPIGYRIGNRYGSRDELISLCRKAKKFGIKIIVDVVLNHMGGSENSDNMPHPNVDEYLIKNKEYWKKGPILIGNDYNDRAKITTGSMPFLPAINIENKFIQDKIIAFLDELVECGVNGFRYDCAKHIALNEEGGTFWTNVAKRYMKDNFLSIGEVICATQELVNKYVNLGLHIVLHPFDNIKGDKIIYSVESHDSYLSEDVKNTTDISIDEINNKYFDLTSNNDKTLYYLRPNDNSWKNSKIKFANKK